MKYKYGTTHYDTGIGVQYSVDNGVLYKYYKGTGKWKKPYVFTLEEVLADKAVRKVKQ
jgi:hypothetical protein